MAAVENFSWGSTKDRYRTPINASAADLALPTDATDADVAAIAHLCKHLRSLDLCGCGVTDSGLRHVADLLLLQKLVLHGCTRITDAGMVHVAALPRLQDLNIGACKITGAGLKHLSVSPQLHTLDLRGITTISDADMPHVAGLLQIQKVQLDGTPITDAGIRAFKEAQQRAMTAAVTAAPGAHRAREEPPASASSTQVEARLAAATAELKECSRLLTSSPAFLRTCAGLLERESNLRGEIALAASAAFSAMHEKSREELLREIDRLRGRSVR